MNFRLREIPSWLGSVICMILISLLIYTIKFVITISLDKSHSAYLYINNNYTSGFFVAVAISILTGIFGIWRGICIPWFNFRDNRTVVSKSDLPIKFYSDASCEPKKEAGWTLHGNGIHSESKIIFQTECSATFYDFRSI